MDPVGLGIVVAGSVGWLGFIAATIQRRYAAHAALAQARTELDKIVDNDQAWKPAHILARTEAIFARIEEARAGGDAKLMQGIATAAGEESVRKTVWVAGAMRPEPRELGYAAIALTGDRPGVLDDKAWLLVNGAGYHELWRLVRVANGDWQLDAIEADPAAIKATVGLG